jgi:hypothetical protein
MWYKMSVVQYIVAQKKAYFNATIYIWIRLFLFSFCVELGFVCFRFRFVVELGFVCFRFRFVVELGFVCFRFRFAVRVDSSVFVLS